jgi:hypothetical protein
VLFNINVGLQYADSAGITTDKFKEAGVLTSFQSRPPQAGDFGSEFMEKNFKPPFNQAITAYCMSLFTHHND